MQLAILAPGVSGLDYAQPATINSGRRPDELRPGGTALQANGVRSYLNQVLVDGIDATEMISQTFVVRPAVEGVQEFKVLTNNAGAEYGRGAGAVINITTKSGGNQFHGSVFEFLRNSALDAKNFFDRADQKIPAVPPQPVRRRNRRPYPPRPNFLLCRLRGLPRGGRADPRRHRAHCNRCARGDFSGVAPNGIFDPLTTNTAVSPATRQRFPGDQIPASRFDPIAARLVTCTHYLSGRAWPITTR